MQFIVKVKMQICNIYNKISYILNLFFNCSKIPLQCFIILW